MAGQSGGGNLVALAIFRDENLQIITTEVTEGFAVVPSQTGGAASSHELFAVTSEDSHSKLHAVQVPQQLPMQTQPHHLQPQQLPIVQEHQALQSPQQTWIQHAALPQWQTLATDPEQVAWSLHSHPPLQPPPIHAWVQQDVVAQTELVQNQQQVHLQEVQAQEELLPADARGPQLAAPEEASYSEGGSDGQVVENYTVLGQTQVEPQLAAAVSSENSPLVWKENLTKALVLHCKSILPQPWGSKKIDAHLWEQVASKVSQQCRVSVNGDSCASKFRKLENKYMKVVEFRNRFGATRKKWKFYSDLEEILGGVGSLSQGAEREGKRKRKKKGLPTRNKRHQSLASEMADMLKGPAKEEEEEKLACKKDGVPPVKRIRKGPEMSCNCKSWTIDTYPELKELLPTSCEYKVCEFEKFDGGFTCVLRLSIDSEINARRWKDSFQKSSLTTWRVDRTYSESGLKNVYKEDFRCHHNTRPRRDHSSHKKNTQCNAKLMVQVKRVVQRLRSKDPHLPSHPMLVRLRHKHNHPIDSTDVLCYRDVDAKVKAKFVELFKAGHTPLSVMRVHKHDLQMEHGENFHKIVADRKYNPDTSWCYRFYEIFRKENGMPSDTAILSSLKSSVRAYNQRTGVICAQLAQLGPDFVAVAICTPLMRRVHAHLPRCRHVVFLDSSRRLDRKKHRLFLLLSDSPAGGLPLGVLATSGESEQALETALEMFVGMLPESAFCGRGREGPVMFLADDNAPERNALKTVFPSAVTLLCPVHLLRGVWHFLWDAKSEVAVSQRTHLFHLVRGMVYAESRNDLSEKFGLVMRDPTANSHPAYLKQVQALYDKRDGWALCYQEGVNFGEDAESNLCEAAALVMRDKVLTRTKNFSLAQQVDFILSRLDLYYENSLMQALSNRFLELNHWRFGVLSQPDVERFTIVQLSEFLYQVTHPPTAQSFQLDMGLGLCSCSRGMVGTPCEHQFAVSLRRNVLALNFLPLARESCRRMLMEIAPEATTDSVTGTALESVLEAVSETALENKPEAKLTEVELSDYQGEGWQTVEESVEEEVMEQEEKVDDENRKMEVEEVVTSAPSAAQVLEKRLRTLVGQSLEKLQGNPDKFQVPLTAFVERWERLVAGGRDAPLLSAMLRFGK